jgi:hypothetical protein
MVIKYSYFTYQQNWHNSWLYSTSRTGSTAVYNSFPAELAPQLFIIHHELNWLHSCLLFIPSRTGSTAVYNSSRAELAPQLFIIHYQQNWLHSCL